jgi:hypothetical protein
VAASIIDEERIMKIFGEKLWSKRLAVFAAIASLSLVAVGCGDDDDDGNNGTPTDTGGTPDGGGIDGGEDAGPDTDDGGGEGATARVQVIHNAADPAASTVDVFANGSVLINDFDFRTATPYVDVPADTDLTIAIAGPDAADGAGDTTLDDGETVIEEFSGVRFDADGTYLVIANGVANPDDFADNPDGEEIALSLDVFADARETTQSDDMAEVLVYHGATDVPAVDLTIDNAGSAQVSDLTYGSFAGYLEVSPAPHVVDVAPTGVMPLHFQTPALPQDPTFTVVASGFFDPSSNQDGPALGLFAFPSLPLSDSERVQAIPLEQAARLQVIHASPDDAASTVDVWVNDALTLDDVSYLSGSPFLTVPSGVDLEVDLTAADATDNSDPAYSQTIGADAITPASTWVAIASGFLGDNFEIRASMAQESAADDEVALQIFHGAPDAPNVDVSAADGAVSLASDLAFGGFSDIASVGANDVTVDVTVAADDSAVASFPVALSSFAGQYLTVVARGTLDETDDTDFGVTAFGTDGAGVELTTP